MDQHTDFIKNVVSDNRTPVSREEERSQLAKEVRAFKRKGGKVKNIETRSDKEIIFRLKNQYNERSSDKKVINRNTDFIKGK